MLSGYSKHFFLGLLLTIAAIIMGLSPRPAQGYDVTHPDNLLDFTSSNSSSGDEHSQAVDNSIGDSTGDNGLLFGPGDGQIVAVSGFNSSIAVIRYYTLTSEGIRFPDSVTIKSSDNPTTSIDATDYETNLGTFLWEATDFTMVPATGRGGDGFIDLYISAPPGTQSLYFDFEGASAGARVSEVQAFAPDPVTVCIGDFDTDGDVDGSDLAVFAADFGRTNCDAVPRCEGDFDVDNDVDGSDLAVFAADFGRTDCDFPVYFPDLNFEEAIRDAISKPTGDILHSDLQDLTTLHASFREIVELEGLQYCMNLSTIYLGGNQITDISVLAGLVNLSTLDLGDNQITDISVLVGLVNLSTLHLEWNQITDISVLAGLVNLSTLTLHLNQINDISAMAGLVNLSLLHLENNFITDISPLVNNPGIGSGDFILLRANLLDSTSCTVHILELVSRGATVYHDCP